MRKRKGLLVQNTVTGQDRTEGSAAHCEEKKRAVGAEHGDRTGQDRTEGSAAHCEEKKRAVGAEHGDRTGQDRGVCSTL